MTRTRLARSLPGWKSASLAVLAAVLLILAFPDFEYWFLAWFALVPLMFAVELEKASVWRSFVTGWLFGTVFFYGTCWWLTYAPIHYAGFPPWLAYSLMMVVAVAVGVFPAIFAGVFAILLRRFGSPAFLAAPFVWVFTEFLRYWLTGNDWNAIGYSQAFSGHLEMAQVGGVLLMSFWVVLPSTLITFVFSLRHEYVVNPERSKLFPFLAFAVFGWSAFLDPKVRKQAWSDDVDLRLPIVGVVFALPIIIGLIWWAVYIPKAFLQRNERTAFVVAVQPNVPMSGLDQQKLADLRDRQIRSAESHEPPDFRAAIEEDVRVYGVGREDQEREIITRIYNEDYGRKPKLVILPESPMNFMYNDDREFQQFINDFARRNNVSVLFNSAEPDPTNGKYFNSAVMVGPDGRKVDEYDKIYLLPFGEAVPSVLDGIVPGFVGNFSYGREYDLFPVGDARAGVMICFESHFGALSRRYAEDGADVLIEMTNDGYLGPTPVLRQHLANAVFRAVETDRPVLRVTNVGVTAYINERGQVLDPLPSYTEGTRVWSVSKSDGSQTFYVRFGDWFAWLSTIITVLLLMWCLKRQPIKSVPGTE